MTSPDFDPVLPLAEAAEYVGFRGKYRTRQLARLNLERTAMPGRGRRPRFGIRLSVLNAYLDRLNDPRARSPRLRAEPIAEITQPREAGKFARQVS